MQFFGNYGYFLICRYALYGDILCVFCVPARISSLLSSLNTGFLLAFYPVESIYPHDNYN